ncbi:hypothetical protein VNO80_18218 [Phaseolus coccineus]|uniref:Uncharacterized protein n=1 Tax=Phaseolus coccineus TaxID=3886 RepID=A0AAN9QZ98_PHACN
MALLFTCDNFTWNLAHSHGLSLFLFLESGTASTQYIMHGGLATSISNFQNPSPALSSSYDFHFPNPAVLTTTPSSTSPTFSFAFSRHNSYHSSREKPNFHHQISYHNPISTSQHSS